MDKAVEPELAAYVRGVVGAFADDQRILAWDIWNEPDNPGGDVAEDVAAKVERVDELLPRAFTWRAACIQPAAHERGLVGLEGPAQGSVTTKIQLEQSDIISFHDYGWPESLRVASRNWRGWQAILCTEYMARGAEAPLTVHCQSPNNIT